MKRLIYILMSIGLLTACSSDDNEKSTTTSNKRVALNIIAGIERQPQGITRATETSWETDDNIGVYMTGYKTYSIFTDGDGTRAENLEYTFGDGTNYETWVANDHVYRLFSPSSKKIYLSSTTIDVFGYYPYKPSLTNPREYQIDLSSQDNQKALDFMTAKHENANNAAETIQLLFHHRLTKLVFNLRQGEGLLAGELKKSTISPFTIDHQPTTATYNIYTSGLTIPSGNYDGSTITPKKMDAVATGYDLTYEAVILPNNDDNRATNRTVTITFYTNEDDKITNTFTIDSDTHFEEGCKYVYNVTVNAMSITVDTEETFTDQW